MRRQDTYVGVIRFTVVVCAIGFGWSSFVLAEKPASPPAPSTTVQEEKATPAESGKVQERGVIPYYVPTPPGAPKPIVRDHRRRSKPPTGGTTKPSPNAGPIQ